MVAEMKIGIGSLNKVKVEAIKEVFAQYPLFADAEFFPKGVKPGVSSQPMGFEEILKGARNRSFEACNGNELGVGIEGGFVKVPETKTGYMLFEACAIFDGKQYHLGMTSGFEQPKEVMRLILQKNLELSDAWRLAGLTEKKKIGEEEGTIGILTKGRINRKEYTKQAVMNALIHLEHPHLY